MMRNAKGWKTGAVLAGFLVAGMPAFAVLDESGNGISDVYERQYGLTGQESAGSDLDGDGWTLAQEYVLGTDPTVADPSPILLNGFTVTGGGGLTYEFMAHAGLRYSIEYADNLSSNVWIQAPEILGNDTLYPFLDSATNAARFYRLNALGSVADTDGDGLDSREEALAGTSTGLADSDGDGLPDGYEAITASADPAVAGSHLLAALDYFENCESLTNGLLNGQDGWVVVADKQARVQAGSPCTGLKGIQLTALEQPVLVEKYFDGAAVSNVWIDLYVLPGATGAEPAVFGSLAATVVYFTDAGHLKAFDGTALQWVEDSFSSGVDVLAWRRLTFCLDYENQQWLVYVNGQLVNPAPGGVPSFFGFSNPSPFFYRLAFEVQGSGNELYIDDILVSTAAPSGLDVTP